MSEREPGYNSEHESDGPEMRIHIVSGGEVLATPENTQLYEYIAINALYNHIFVEQERVEHRMIGMYVRPWEDDYDRMRQYMMDTGYPSHHNIIHVTSDDVANYDSAVENREANSPVAAEAPEVEDDLFIPDDWL
jgi:hypothetical protein